MADRRRVLIAGASSDIGLALMHRLAKAGWHIGAHCHRGRDRIEKMVGELTVSDGNFRIFESDLSSRDECRRLVDDFATWAGGIDALVQLTGNVSAVRHWETLEEPDWLADIAVNLSAPFFLAQRAFAYMKQGSGGRIVLMSTASASHGGGQDTLAYGVAKAGVECLAKGLARGGAPHNILVNALAPGLIDTRFHRDQLGRDADAVRRRADLVPLKRAGRPEDVARMAEYLLSEGGDFITGEVIAISGGDWL
jgi:3-oxoacyl-[acyl-carrier protein] reductase